MKKISLLLTSLLILSVMSFASPLKLAAITPSINVSPSTSTPQPTTYLPYNQQYVKEKKAINPDTVGWIYIPDTTINNVVMFKPEYKNLFYGDKDFYRREDKNGTFFADYRSSFQGGNHNGLTRNTVLYGHSWSDNKNDILFAPLKNYRNEDFARNHPYIYFSTENEDMVWEVFAVFDAHVNFPYIQSEPPFLYTVEELNDAIRSSSIYQYDVKVSPQDKVLTLSTCTFSVPGHPKLPAINDYRFAIAAKLVPASTATKKQASFTINPSPVPPDTYNIIPKGYHWVSSNPGA